MSYLVIRQGQRKILAEEAFVNRLADHARGPFKQLIPDLPAGELYLRLREGIARGRDHGFTWESSLGIFAILSLVYGPTFYELAPFASVLSNTASSEEARMESLVNSVW
jgi:hypothetical protein